MPTNKEIVQAIKESIKHWQDDIRKPFEAGDSIITYLGIGRIWKLSKTKPRYRADSCALCKLFNERCKNCAFQQYYERRCSSDASKWEQFNLTPTLENANAVIEELKELLKKVQLDRY